MFFNPSAQSWRPSISPLGSEVLQFHHRLPDYNITPLVSLPQVAKELGASKVFVKDESSRFGLPAFKILGASWAIYKAVAAKCQMPLDCNLESLGFAAQARGLKLVTCTEGNWGRATARMAKYLNIPAIVFVPDFMDEPTQEKISNEGAKVVVVDGDYDVSIDAARKEAQSDNGLLVMDTSWPGYEEIPQWVVEGYSTMLSETDQQLETIGQRASHVLASVGVGSWAQAVCMHYKAQEPPAKVVAVEPESAACLMASLEAGHITPIVTGHTIMNGMCCGTVSLTAWEVLANGVDVSVTVDDWSVHRDVQYLHSHGVKGGPCGAATLTALRKLFREPKLRLDNESVVVLFSTEGARDYQVPM